MKKLSILLILTLTLGMTACGSAEVEEVAEETEQVTEEIAEEIEEEIEIEEAVEEEVEETEETEEVTEEKTDTEDAEETAEEEIEETTEEEETEVAISVTEYSATLYANTSANVRAGNSTDYAVVGTVSLNTEITVTGKCDNGWYRIDYNGEVAYISGKVVSEEKTEVSASTSSSSTSSSSTATTSTSTTTTTSHWYDDYELYTWYDMGTYMFYMCGDVDYTVAMHMGFDADGYYEMLEALEARYSDEKYKIMTSASSPMESNDYMAINMWYVYDSEINWTLCKGKTVWD